MKIINKFYYHLFFYLQLIFINKKFQDFINYYC